MTTPGDDDLFQPGELSRELPAIDLDATTAARIAYRARADVGRGPSPWRLVEPVLAAALTGSYLVWSLIKVVEALR